MHSKGVLQIVIESAIPLRQPHWNTAVDLDVTILPWSMVNGWLIRDTSVLFLRMLSKIDYCQSKNRGPKKIYSMKPVHSLGAIDVYIHQFCI